MDVKNGPLSLDEIHKSIEEALTAIQQQHKEIQSSSCDVDNLQRIVDQVCRPISDIVRHPYAANVEALRVMLMLHEVVVRATITGSPISSIAKLRERETNCQPVGSGQGSGVCSLPPVVHSPLSGAQKPRSSIPATLHYPPITNASLTQSRSRVNGRLTSPNRKQSPVRNDVTSNAEVSERHDQLRRYVEEVERHMRTLQGTFITFTQKVLVPLQTFCKLQRSSAKLRQKDGQMQSAKTAQTDSKSTGDVDQCEMSIVETMNQLRQILWPSQDNVPNNILSDEGISKQVASAVDCSRFPVVRHLPDVLHKFDYAVQRASLWLKRDILYTQNAKSALYRAHRRYLKTEKLWQEARQSHRQLLSEWDYMNAEAHTNTSRLETLEQDMEMLREDLERSQDQRKTMELKLRTTSENIDHLRARHRALRKRIIMLGTKIENRERNYEFMDSRIRSSRADQDAMQEKIRISEEYASSLQTKMEQFHKTRAAWNRRYVEKSDPEILKSRLQSAQLRIPLPAVREKTFVLKSKLDNLREAFTLIEDGLEESGVHWSTLCYHLNWPEHVYFALPNIKSRKTEVAPIAQKDLTDSDDSSSTSSASSTSAGKPGVVTMRRDRRAANRIADHIKARFPENESQQRSFMLRMWLRTNGQQATIDKLIEALRSSKLLTLSAYVEKSVQ